MTIAGRSTLGSALENCDERQSKIDRERRLQWQSRILLATVLSASAAGLLLLVLSAWTPASVEGLAICAAFGLLVWLLRAATPAAAATGFVLTSCLYLATVAQPHGGWLHTALLPGLALFVLAYGATRFRRAQKERTGLAESRRGRNASQVAANMGFAALAALAAAAAAAGWFHGLSSFPAAQSYRWLRTLPLAFTPAIAALAEAAADTVSSEIGQAIGGMPVLLTTLRRVPPGTDGAVSLTGTLAGCAAAAVVVLVAIPTLGLPRDQAAIAWTAAIAALFADSLIGATLERGGWLNNDLVNCLSTAIAALLVLAL